MISRFNANPLPETLSDDSHHPTTTAPTLGERLNRLAEEQGILPADDSQRPSLEQVLNGVETQLGIHVKDWETDPRCVNLPRFIAFLDGARSLVQDEDLPSADRHTLDHFLSHVLGPAVEPLRAQHEGTRSLPPVEGRASTGRSDVWPLEPLNTIEAVFRCADMLEAHPELSSRMQFSVTSLVATKQYVVDEMTATTMTLARDLSRAGYHEIPWSSASGSPNRSPAA